MRRLASSLFHKKDKNTSSQEKSSSSKDGKRRPLSSDAPSDASSRQSYPPSLAPTASSSATSISIRTPPTDRGQETPSLEPGSPWKSMFRGRKSRKENEDNKYPHVYTGDETRIAGSRSKLYSAHYGDSSEDFQTPAQNAIAEDASLLPPVRPFLRASTRSDSSSPNSSRSSLSPPSAYTNLQALTISKINQTQFAITHPLLNFPHADALFPRSSNPPDSLSLPPPTFSIQLFRTRILKRLDARNLSPSEEESIRPFVARPRMKPKPHVVKQYADEEAMINQVARSNDWSRGLNRWANRPCFEERNVVWVRSVGGDLVATAVTGRSIAALEFSEGLEALAGLGEHAVLPQSSSRPNRSSLYLDLPSLGRSTPSPSPSTAPVTPTSPHLPLPLTVAAGNKRTVRFSRAQNSDSGSTTARLARDLRERERERREAERERLERERIIEHKRQQRLQEEVAAARLRRESFKHYGGSTSIRALADLAARDEDLQLPPPRMPQARRTATDPGSRNSETRSNGSSSPRSSQFLDIDVTAGRSRSRLSALDVPPQLAAVSSSSPASRHRSFAPGTGRDSTHGSVRSLDTRQSCKPRASSGSDVHTEDARSTRSLPRSTHSYGPPLGTIPPMPSPYFQYAVPPVPMMVPNPNFYPQAYAIPPPFSIPPPMPWGSTLPGSPGHRPIGIPDGHRRSSNPAQGPAHPRPPLASAPVSRESTGSRASQSRSLPVHRSNARPVLT